MQSINELCDIVRQTAFAIHVYHGHGHLEKVYENALAHRLAKAGLNVVPQAPLQVLDEDGTPLGDYFADLQFVPTTPQSFLFVLRRHPHAQRFWKDLMVGILRQLEDDPTRPKITLHEKSDMPPVELAAVK